MKAKSANLVVCVEMVSFYVGCLFFVWVLINTDVVVVAKIGDRAVGAGPAGSAAAGPIFGQPTRAKVPYELRRVVQFLLQE